MAFQVGIRNSAGVMIGRSIYGTATEALDHVARLASDAAGIFFVDVETGQEVPASEMLLQAQEEANAHRT